MAAKTTPNSPDYGRRLLLTLIDETASTTPQRKFVSVQQSDPSKTAFEDITYDAFANAVNRCSSWLEDELRRMESSKAMAYVGPQDLLYPILVIAIKTSYRLLLKSPRNTLDAHLHLLNTTGCGTLLVPASQQHMTSRILSRQHFCTIQIPDFRFFLDGQDRVAYPYRKSFSEGRYDPFAILHTSGSTGVPQPVVLALGTLAAVDAYQLTPSLGGNETIGPPRRGKRPLLGFPLFHAAGLQFMFGFGFYCGLIIVMPPARGPLTAETVALSLDLSKAHTTALPPSLVVDLYRNPNHHDCIRSLDSILYAGGPLPDEVGSELCHLTRLTTIVGATEYPLSPLEHVKPEDWQYVKFSPCGGVSLRPCQDTDICEQVFVKDKEMDNFQGIFATVPNFDEFSLKDTISTSSHRAWTIAV